ncbi:MAG: N-acetylmuramoyl-L-alanine amidase [Alphaproteobacteria bacterium]|nr:N-acetylmuramoyl-L-alanine amidase [Alphaproteobacteria bacterium]
MSSIRRLGLYILLCIVLLLGQSEAALAFDINDVRFGNHDERTRMVFDLSQNTDFRIFALSDPYRLVIDLPSFSWRAGNVTYPPATKITALRHGNLKPGISRLVFDLNAPVGLEAAFILPAQRGAGKPDRLVIDYTPVSKAQFAAEKNKVLGKLDVDGTNSPSVTPDSSDSSYQSASSTYAPPPPRKNQKPLVVIDPGHGGVDPGAISSSNLREKNVVLALAKELKQQLLATGQYRVMLTREEDVFIKLSDRVKFARKHGADLFVSIHADSIEKKNVRGASFYTLSEKASDAQTAKLAARENRADLIAGIDLSVEDEQVANILVDLAMRDTTNQGKYFANQMVDAFNANGLKILPNAHRHAGFAVLKAPDIPSILVEAGFMSNNEEAAQLNSSSHRKNVARTLKRGIDAYFEQVKKNQRI